MIKDTVRPNGTVKRVQYVRAIRRGTSSMGTPYKKGDAIIHLSSSRCTGETFVLMPSDVIKTLFRTPPLLIDVGGFKRPGRWVRPADWAKQLSKQWLADFKKTHGHSPSVGCKTTCPEHFSE